MATVKEIYVEAALVWVYNKFTTGYTLSLTEEEAARAEEIRAEYAARARKACNEQIELHKGKLKQR